MTGKPGDIPEDQPVSWGRALLDASRAHVRQTRDGTVVAHDTEGHCVGFAICGTWLVEDCADPADTPKLIPCSVCLDMLNRNEFIDWER